jgi:hypothetical protein
MIICRAPFCLLSFLSLCDSRWKRSLKKHRIRFRSQMSFMKKRHGVARRAWSVLAINLPAKGSKLPDAAPAHLLRIELTTRITTQRLHYRSGEEETAAESVHMLFPKVRELMSNYPDAKIFCKIGLRLLDQVLRPYTARWHGWMTESEESAGGTPRFRDERVRRMFRVELRELQARLVGYQRAFESLADGEAVDPDWREPDTAAQLAILKSLSDSEERAGPGQQTALGRNRYCHASVGQIHSCRHHRADQRERAPSHSRAAQVAWRESSRGGESH